MNWPIRCGEALRMERRWKWKLKVVFPLPETVFIYILLGRRPDTTINKCRTMQMQSPVRNVDRSLSPDFGIRIYYENGRLRRVRSSCTWKKGMPASFWELKSMHEWFVIESESIPTSRWNCELPRNSDLSHSCRVNLSDHSCYLEMIAQSFFSKP